MVLPKQDSGITRLTHRCWTHSRPLQPHQARQRNHQRQVIGAAGPQTGVTARRSQPPAPPPPPAPVPGAMEPPATFMAKVKAAWQIFFPPKPDKQSPREAGKTRLRMILVADRYVFKPRKQKVVGFWKREIAGHDCHRLEMRHSIVRAVSDYVEIEAEDMVEVNITTEPEMGTVYSVAVPVRRVRPQARSDTLVDGQMEQDGVTLIWDEDPQDRFPYGC